ncbi:tetratricopeptide repeat protein [Methylocaldum sp. MU1018]
MRKSGIRSRGVGFKKALNEPSPFGKGRPGAPIANGLAGSAGQTMSPNRRFNRSLLNAPIILFAVWSGSAGADDYGITASELQQMPGYCRALSEGHYAEDAKRLRNLSLSAKGFTSIHHFCQGLKFLLRADRAKDAQSKGFNLQSAIGNFDYVLDANERMPATSPRLKAYRAQAHFYKAEALKRANRSAEMAAEYIRAIQLKPDYAHAYAQLFDFYLKVGDREEAEKTLEAGLKHAPNSSALLKRREKLK